MQIETTQPQTWQATQAVQTKSTKGSGGAATDVSPEAAQAQLGSLDTLRLTSIVRNKADLALAQIDQQQTLADASKFQATSDALGQIRQVFLRVRELTTRASLSTDKGELDSIRAELQTLDQAVSRIIQSTRFEGTALIGGTTESPSEVIGSLADTRNSEPTKATEAAQNAPLALVPLATENKQSFSQKTWDEMFVALDTQDAALQAKLSALAIRPTNELLKSTLSSDEATKLAALLKNSLAANPERANALAGELGQSNLLASSF